MNKEKERNGVPLLASSAEEKIPRLSPLPPVDLVFAQCRVAKRKRGKDKEWPQHCQTEQGEKARIDPEHGRGVPGNKAKKIISKMQGDGSRYK